MQRPGKRYKAAAFDGADRISTWDLIKLFKDAKGMTDGDVSFYFEQLEDFFRNYKPEKGIPRASKVLGL